ncbi:MAG: Glycosyl transferase family 2 [Microgenomates group bacterium GW2011_GWA2_47_8]|nr:MAG: Glycosyl transferase family 2 [Microgenomates group bacterium GW2011_GWA2_47_8]
MKLSAVVLTHNSAAVIGDCLQSLRFADEIIVIDSGSTDNTLALASTARIYKRKLVSFAAQRNFALGQAKYPWVLMIDSDERVSAALAKEIRAVIQIGSFSAYRMKRLNYFFGRVMKHGGYWPDWQTRLFRVKDFLKYAGTVHESPHFNGPLGSLKTHLIHFSHNNISECLEKSIVWTKKEAEQFIKAGHPPVTWWRIIKVMVWEFCYRYFKKMGFLDGYVGLVESLLQAMNRFFVYQQVWEMQQS